MSINIGSFAQVTRSTSPTGKIPLTDFLTTIETECDLIFNYDLDLVDSIQINPNIPTKDPSFILAYLQDATPFKFVRRKEYVIISPKPSAEIQSDKTVISGKIIDLSSGDALPYASVILKGTEQGTQTDERGNFELSYFDKPSLDSVEIHFLGYQTSCISLNNFRPGVSNKITLASQELMIDDILIKEDAILPLEFNGEGGYYDLRSDQLPLQGGWGETDVLRMLQIIPGIQTPDESSANLHIRGGTPDQNLILIDEIPVYKSGHFFGMFSTLNPHIVDQVKIYKGGFGANYGGRVSGVIDIKNRLTNINKITGTIGANPLNYHASVEAPLFKKRSSLLIAIRESFTDNYQTAIFQSSFDQKFQTGRISEYRNIEEEDLLTKNDAAYNYEDFNFRWQYRFKKDDEISLSHFSNEDGFRYEFEIDQPFFTTATIDENNSKNRGSSFNISNRWASWWQSRLSIIDSKFENNFLTNYTADLDDPFHLKTDQVSILNHDRISLNQIFDLSSNQKLELGMEANKWDISFQALSEKIWESDPDSFILDLSNTVVTTYLDYTFQYQDLLFLQAGIRKNKLNDFKKSKWEPRLSLKYKIPSSPWLVKWSFGTYHQFISQVITGLDDDNLGVNNGIWITSELNVVPIVTSNDFTTGITFRKNGWTIDLEAYRKNTVGLSTLNLRIDRSDDQLSPGESKAKGIEFVAQKKFNKYRSLLSYNLASVKYNFPEFNRGLFFPATHDRRHYLQWNHLYALGNFDFVLAFHLGSGTPFTVPSQIIELQGDEPGEIYHELQYELRNTGRLAIYHRWDFSVHYRWVRKYMQARATFSLFNLTNRSNVTNRKYRIWYPDEDRSAPEMTYFDRLGLRVTPSLFFTLTF